ncbi:MAG: 5-deoxy-glucuronate isomerase [Woeseiaceae bacterium]|nr:5-deoxy-glucuronate isomerase [Woeseiaceae bacterium]
MADLLVRSGAPDREHCVIRVTPESAGWRYVGFAVHRLGEGESLRQELADRETCIVVLSGRVDVAAADATFEDVGERARVFDDTAPHAVYVGAGTSFTVTARGAAEVALCTAPGKPGHASRRISPDEMSVEERGSGTNRRIVRNILPETMEADSLLIAEVITPGGNWSSYPPHKHDDDNVPQESALEETYYHRLDPPQGFAFQRVYTDDRSIDETLSVSDGDVVLVPRGYHPVGAPHGYDLYYLNVMAGPRRTWIFRNDPDHDWIAKSSS